MPQASFYSTDGTEIDILGIKPSGASVAGSADVPAGMHGSAYIQESVYSQYFPSSTSAGAYGFATAAAAASVLVTLQLIKAALVDKGIVNNDA